MFIFVWRKANFWEFGCLVNNRIGTTDWNFDEFQLNAQEFYKNFVRDDSFKSKALHLLFLFKLNCISDSPEQQRAIKCSG